MSAHIEELARMYVAESQYWLATNVGWVEQCEAAEGIEADYGTEKALGYLIGEKLLNFPEWRKGS